MLREPFGAKLPSIPGGEPVEVSRWALVAMYCSGTKESQVRAAQLQLFKINSNALHEVALNFSSGPIVPLRGPC